MTIIFSPGIRALLLNSEEQECPQCHTKYQSPDTLIPNRFLRTAVTNFRSETGYTKATAGVAGKVTTALATPPAPTAETTSPLPVHVEIKAEEVNEDIKEENKEENNEENKEENKDENKEENKEEIKGEIKEEEREEPELILEVVNCLLPYTYRLVNNSFC